MTQLHRFDLIRLKQVLGRRALARGDIAEACVVLRGLDPADFDGASIVGEACLRVLSDPHATRQNLRTAISILSQLPVRLHRSQGS